MGVPSHLLTFTAISVRSQHNSRLSSSRRSLTKARLLLACGPAGDLSSCSRRSLSAALSRRNRRLHLPRE
jgi:hypothetical protein